MAGAGIKGTRRDSGAASRPRAKHRLHITAPWLCNLFVAADHPARRPILALTVLRYSTNISVNAYANAPLNPVNSAICNPSSRHNPSIYLSTLFLASSLLREGEPMVPERPRAPHHVNLDIPALVIEERLDEVRLPVSDVEEHAVLLQDPKNLRGVTR